MNSVHHLVKSTTEGPGVKCFSEYYFVLPALWWQVNPGTPVECGNGVIIFLDFLAYAKIRKFNHIVGSYQDVIWLDIMVDYVSLVVDYYIQT
jgi:hypothetical protein